MEISERLARIIRTPSLLITAVLFVMLSIFMIVQSHNRMEMLISQLRKDYITEQKRHLRTAVLQMAFHAQYQSEALYDDLVIDVQERMNDLADIANRLYRENKKKSKKELRALIVSALRNIRYRNGRGYPFIYSLRGDVVMMPLEPRQEGSVAWDQQDEKGLLYVRELINRALAEDSSLLQWSLRQGEGDQEKTFEKIGSAFYFAPCEIVIGIGENIDELMSEVRQQLLDWVKYGQAGNVGHLFVVDKNGHVLAKSAAAPDGSGLEGKFSFAAVEAMEGKEGVVSYPPDEHQETEPLFFLKAIPGWQWVVGAREDTEAVARYVAEKSVVITRQSRINLMKLLFGCLAIMGMVFWFVSYQSRRVSRYLYEKMMFDDLTGLPSRNYFICQMQSEIEAGKAVAVLNVDIDGFSVINEWFGRTAGDLLLCGVADRLRQLVSSQSQLCRVSGDEFLLYFKDAMSADISSCIKGVKTILSTPFLIEKEEIKITCAIGGVSAGKFRVSASELLRRANIVLFRMKDEGKGQHGCYDLAIEKALQRNKIIADTFSAALANRDFYVVYQPQILSKDEKLYGVEALCRWTSSSLGPVSPDEFIPIAEKSGFILPLGFYVFRQACKDVMRWMDNGEDAVHVSINISPRQLLHRDFIPEVRKIVKEVGISASRITLEITENLLATDLEEVRPILEQLDSAGFEVSLDDFGTGASSLIHVHNLPIHELKIDQMFIRKMKDSCQAASLVKSILAIGNANSLRIVAEGVSDKEHVDWLKAHNCDLQQGYFFSKPLEIDALMNVYPGKGIADTVSLRKEKRRTQLG